MDAVTTPLGTVAVSAAEVHREDLWGAIRGVACVASSAAIAWHDHDVAKYCIGVIALVASPALAKAVILSRFK